MRGRCGLEVRSSKLEVRSRTGEGLSTDGERINGCGRRGGRRGCSKIEVRGLKFEVRGSKFEVRSRTGEGLSTDTERINGCVCRRRWRVASRGTDTRVRPYAWPRGCSLRRRDECRGFERWEVSGEARPRTELKLCPYRVSPLEARSLRPFASLEGRLRSGHARTPKRQRGDDGRILVALDHEHDERVR